MINHGVTVLEMCREDWLKAAENRYVVCDSAGPYGTVAIIFVDPVTGEHFGNARIVCESKFGGYEGSVWTWNMLSQLTGLTVSELKERFPYEAKLSSPGDCEMTVYEIEPIGDDSLLLLLCSTER